MKSLNYIITSWEIQLGKECANIMESKNNEIQIPMLGKLLVVLDD